MSEYLEEHTADLARLLMLEMYERNPGSPLAGSFSILDLYIVLYFSGVVARETSSPFIIPKGTSSLALYAIQALAGELDTETLQAFGTERLPTVLRASSEGVEVTVSGLGVNIGCAVGAALAKKIKGEKDPVICFLGDGEVQEGVEQAAKRASALKLNNLCVVLDCNILQSFFPVAGGDHTMTPDTSGKLSAVEQLWRICGWDVIEINGHDHEQIRDAYRKIGQGEKPLLIIAHTVKGKGISFMENDGRFSHVLTAEQLEAARSEVQSRLLGFVDMTPPLKVKEHKGMPMSRLLLPTSVDEHEQYLRFTFIDYIQALVENNPGRILRLQTDNPYLFYRHDEQLELFSPESVPHAPVFVGINEGLAIDMARGAAACGVLPIYGSPATHLLQTGESWRAICMDGLPALVVGNKPGSELQNWGPTHTEYDDVLWMRKHGAHVYQPANTVDLRMILDNISCSPERFLPAYLRLPVESVPIEAAYTVDRQRAWKDGFYVVREGDIKSSSPTIIASGEMVRYAEEIAASADFPARILNIINLTEINGDALRTAIGESPVIVSLIDAHPDSLSSLLFSALFPAQRARYYPLGVKKPGYGTKQDIYEQNGFGKTDLLQLLNRTGLTQESNVDAI